MESSESCLLYILHKTKSLSLLKISEIFLSFKITITFKLVTHSLLKVRFITIAMTSLTSKISRTKIELKLTILHVNVLLKET